MPGLSQEIYFPPPSILQKKIMEIYVIPANKTTKYTKLTILKKYMARLSLQWA